MESVAEGRASLGGEREAARSTRFADADEGAREGPGGADDADASDADR